MLPSIQVLHQQIIEGDVLLKRSLNEESPPDIYLITFDNFFVLVSRYIVLFCFRFDVINKRWKWVLTLLPPLVKFSSWSFLNPFLRKADMLTSQEPWQLYNIGESQQAEKFRKGSHLIVPSIFVTSFVIRKKERKSPSINSLSDLTFPVSVSMQSPQSSSPLSQL